jgi:hypothetical protein
MQAVELRWEDGRFDRQIGRSEACRRSRCNTAEDAERNGDRRHELEHRYKPHDRWAIVRTWGLLVAAGARAGHRVSTPDGARACCRPQRSRRCLGSPAPYHYER